MDEICRLCLTGGELLPIFEDETNLPVRIMACCSLEVSPSDSLPKFICLDCRYQLDKTYIFRMKSKNAESKLKRHMRLINAGKVSHVFEEEDDSDDYADALAYVQQHEENLKSEELESIHENFEGQLKQLKASETKLRIELKRVKEQLLNKMQEVDDLQHQMTRQGDTNYVLEMLEDESETKVLATKVDSTPGPSKKGGKVTKVEQMVLEDETGDGYVMEDDGDDPIETRYECDPEEYAAIEKAVRVRICLLCYVKCKLINFLI